ncbi:MAG: energy-coupling factor transporter transmembrane component T [Anaerolineales bacterium]
MASVQRNSLYIEGKVGLHRWHPLTKLTLSGYFLVGAATLPNIEILLLAFVILLLPLAAWSGVLRPFIKSCFTVVMPFVISLAVIQGFFTPGETELFHLGRFVFTLEGLLSGETVAARILLALGGALLLMLSTRPDHLMLALTQRGLPNSLAYIVLTSLQIFPRFQDRARVILEAQQSRGLETQVSFFRRARLLVPLTGPLILSSILDVEERAMALEARAFSRPGPRTSLIVLRDSFSQRVLRILLFLAIVALFVQRIWVLFSR